MAASRRSMSTPETLFDDKRQAHASVIMTRSEATDLPVPPSALREYYLKLDLFTRLHIQVSQSVHGHIPQLVRDLHGNIAHQVCCIDFGHTVLSEDLSSPLHVVLLLSIVSELYEVNATCLDLYGSIPLQSRHFKEVISHRDHNDRVVVIGL